MSQLLLIRGADQLLTLRGSAGVRRGAALGDLAIIQDGAILIRDGFVASVGTTRRLENLKEARDAQEISVEGALIMPGLIDPALQLAPAPADNPKRRRASDFYDESLALLRACLQHGILHAQVSASAEQGNLRADVAALRQLAKIGNHPIGMVRSWRIHNKTAHSTESAEDIDAALSHLAQRRLAHAVDVNPQNAETPAHPLLTAARENNIPIHLCWPGGSAETLSDLLNFWKPRSVSCRGTLSEVERSVLSQSAAPVVVSPGALSFDHHPDDSVSQLASQGAAIALSSGYHSREAPVFNMQTSIALAVLRLRLTVEQAISAATINAAHALNLGHALGSLEVGKRADLLVMNLSDYRELPRRWGMNHVGMAIRDGKIMFNRTGWKVSAA